MNGYQLSCGHWVNDREHWEIGTPYACRMCDTMRTIVVGFVRPVTWA